MTGCESLFWAAPLLVGAALVGLVLVGSCREASSVRHVSEGRPCPGCQGKA